MNKVYGTMSVGLLVTALAAWAGRTGLAPYVFDNPGWAHVMQALSVGNFGRKLMVARSARVQGAVEEIAMRPFVNRLFSVTFDGLTRDNLKFCRIPKKVMSMGMVYRK